MNREKILWYVLLLLAILFIPPFIIDRLHPGLILPVREKAVTSASVLADLPPGLSADEQFKRLFRAGREAGHAGNRNVAIANLAAAEALAPQLTENKDESLHGLRQWLASQYEAAEQYPEAVAVYNRLLDSLRETAPDYDPDFGNYYSLIAMICDKEGDWAGLEEASRQAIAAYEKTIQHFDGMVDPQKNVQSAQLGKAVSLSRLAYAYYKEGKMDFAVYNAEQSYRYGSEVKISGTYLKQFATLGLEIATKANDKDAIPLWGQRLDRLSAIAAGAPPGR